SLSTTNHFPPAQANTCRSAASAALPHSRISSLLSSSSSHTSMSSRAICRFIFTSSGPDAFTCNVCASSASRHRKADTPTCSAISAQSITFSKTITPPSLVVRPAHSTTSVSSTKMPTTCSTECARVGDIIAFGLGSVFGLMFDGWSAGSLHFLRGDSSVLQWRLRLIGISPREMVKRLTHTPSISPLFFYNKDLSIVNFRVGNNCSTLQSRPSSPRRLSAQHIDVVQHLMSMLRLPKHAAELARHTSLRAVRANATRWSSIFKMLDQNMCIQDAILRVPAVEDCVPRGATHKRVTTLRDTFQELNSVCVKLQHVDCSLGNVRALFDACIVQYPVMAKYPNAEIVHSPRFENAVLRLTTDSTLSTTNKTQLEPVLVADVVSAAPERREDFASSILRKAKKPRLQQETTLPRQTHPLLVYWSPLQECNLYYREDSYRRPRRGRPRKVTPREWRRIFHLACAEGLTCGKIAKVLDGKVSKWSISRALERTGNAHYIKRKSAPYLTDGHKKKRVLYRHEKLTSSFNSGVVIVSDDKKLVKCYGHLLSCSHSDQCTIGGMEDHAWRRLWFSPISLDLLDMIV
ncbi:TPA: LOW QUALITY PROTEIN: hypothetical protein N0F65_004112, partial [Lagenidium giganteum]